MIGRVSDLQLLGIFDPDDVYLMISVSGGNLTPNSDVLLKNERILIDFKLFQLLFHIL